MSKTEPVCRNCGVKMELGFGVNKGHHRELKPDRWLSGPAELNVKTDGKEMRLIEMWRCPKCGLLESYANQLVDPPTFFNN